MSTEPVYVGVVGASVADAETAAAAEEVGKLLAERGVLVVCGGTTGVMEAACRGAKSAGGTTVGILPEEDRSRANECVDIALATGMGEMRNALIVRTVDVVLAVGGEYGTLSEIAFALRIGRPVVSLNSWDLARAKPEAVDVVQVVTPADAVEAALSAAGARPV